MTKDLLRRRFTVEDFHRMAEAGIVSERDRVELIEGEVVELTPIGSSHAGCVKRLNRLLSKLVGDRALLSIQDPVQTSEHSEPQPDVVLLRPRADDYTKFHPSAADVLLLIEVGDTSCDYDRDVKIPVYGRDGIPEVWLVDLNESRIEIYLDPSADGYATTRRISGDDTVTATLVPEASVSANEILK